jgi:hypothetical protein
MGWQPNPTLSQQLKRLFWEEKLVGAYNAHGVLVTHAGASPEYWYTELGSEELSAQINNRFKEWAEMLRPGQAYPELFAMDQRRGNSNGRDGGGVMWVSWEELLLDLSDDYQDQKITHDPSLRQIVGHTPRGRMEESKDGSMINIDVAGARLGIALVKPDGTVLTASDRLVD